MPRRTRSKSKERESETKADKSQPSRSRRSAAADTESGILALQHTVGNRALSQLLLSNAEGSTERSGGEPHSVNDVVSSSGEQLDSATRNLMESRFDHDFGDVRVHTDAKAGESAEALSARAYTVGTDIVFGAGEYAPETNEGQKRIAHELTHVIQHNKSGNSPSLGLISPHDASEREAEGVADSVARGKAAPTIASAGPGIHRDVGWAKRGPLPDPYGEILLLNSFAKKFPDAGKLIFQNPLAMKLVKEAEAAGVQFGGYAEDGPGNIPWPYTDPDTKSVYVPKARTDAYVASSDFLFELNNAIRSPKLGALQGEARKGAKSTLTAKQYAYQIVEQEVEGMLRTGEIWFDMKKALPKDPKWDAYDSDFFLPSYQAFKDGKKSKDDIIKQILGSKTGADKNKTTEQFYIEQFNKLQKGK
jgi:hypothetical protein